MQRILKDFRASRRGAIAMIFALCLVPIVLLIGLAIDYSFYVQAQQQVSRAAEAAATQAVRTAAAAYALDIDNNVSVTTATSDAKSQGQTAGQKWFLAQAGSLVRGSTSSPSVTVNTNTGATSGGAGFTAQVNYVFTYPPFFNTLFNRPSSSTWVYSNSSTAQAVYQYVEVLLLLDTSGSMQIGANQSDITTLSDNSVCFPTSAVTSTGGDVPLVLGTLNVYPTPTYDTLMATDGDQINFSNLTSATNSSVYTYLQSNGSPFPSTDPHDLTGKCNTSQGYGVAISGNPASQAGAPCAFACHTTSSTVNGNYADPYGQARALGATLRLDVVLSAAEQVAQDLYNSEQTSNQFTLGVYQFNDDVSTIVDGGANAEATTDLTTAKTTIENYDYNYKGNAALLPALLTNSNPNTNFPRAITHLLNGATTTINGSTGSTVTTTVPQLQPVTNTASNPAGDSASNPIKNIFIVTDGLEDSSSSNPGGGNGLSLDFGEMTSSTAENYYTANGSLYNGNATGYCSELKKLGFNVYVLYVTYYPLPFVSYYESHLSEQANYADATDYPSAFTYGAQDVYPRLLTQPTTTAETTGTNPDASVSATAGEVSPTEEALQACATSGDFYIASSASDITTAMTAMLKSAINSSIVVTK